MSSTSINSWSAILVLVFFVISNVAVIFPVCLLFPEFILRRVLQVLSALRITPPPPSPAKKRCIHVNFITVPLFSVLLLLATGAIDGTVVRDGIVGANGVKPLQIMSLFMSLAYLSISLDATGLLRFLAFWVVRKGGSSGPRLFAYLYVFFLMLGIMVGNDPVVLSGTAFLAYLTKASGITPPTAWIFAQFTAANMASVVLVSANITNLVLSGSFSLSFTTYMAHVIVPFLATAICVYPVLFFLFRSPELVPPSVSLIEDEVQEPVSTLKDKRGAIFGSALLLTTLGVLVGTSIIGVPVWEITVPPAVIMLVRDLHYDWTHNRRKPEIQPQPEIELQETACRCEAQNTAVSASDPAPSSVKWRGAICVDRDDLQEPVTVTESVHSCCSPRMPSYPSGPTTLESIVSHLVSLSSATFPTVTMIAKRLPVALLPFAFLMFILVEGLSSKGWQEVFAHGWAAWVRKTGTLGAVGGMGFLSCILCNICGTNIGATILLARVIQLWIAMEETSNTPVSPRARDGAIYALAIGSNYGAFTLTFSASLAGLLWRQILQQKGIRVRPSQFLKLNIPVSFAAMLVSCGVLTAQTYIIHRHD